MSAVKPQALPTPNVLECQHSSRQRIPTFRNMASPFLEEETLPLTRVVGGNVDLDRLIQELDSMYPDTYPDHNITDRDLAFRAGAISIIRYLKLKKEI
jgi:hypothetical protein